METIKKENFRAAFVNTDQKPISRKFLGLMVEEGTGNITVSVVEEVRYHHPDAPEEAVIPVQETRFLKTVKVNSQEASAYRLFSMAHAALKYQLSTEFVFRG